MLKRSNRLALVFPVAALLSSIALAGPAPAASHGPYDEKADAQQLIGAALRQARAENKRVLVDFGANWCGWCRGLHDLFITDPAIAAEVEAGFVVVYVDVGNFDRNMDLVKRYGIRGIEDSGIPVLVVLDAAGQPRKPQDAGDFENSDETGYTTVSVLGFLRAAR